MTPTTFEQQSLLVFVIGLFAVLGAAASFTAILKNLALIRAARKPSPEEAAVREFATKQDLAAFRCEWQGVCKANHDRADKTFGEIFSILRAQNKDLTDRLDRYHAELAQWQQSVERQLGKLQGAVE